jgi:hypothetical protein
VKLRLHGTRAEVTEAICRLVQVLEVVSVNLPYRDRGASVLAPVYLEARRLNPADPSWSAGTPPGDPQDPSQSADAAFGRWSE